MDIWLSAKLLMPTKNNTNSQSDGARLKIEIVSFAYKSKELPKANLLFDVRFIDNPFWIEHLRPFNGLDKNVQDFVLKQNVARHFLDAFGEMVKILIPMHAVSMSAKTGTASEMDSVFTIAFGCTGGWHRSVAIAEESARQMAKLFPQYLIKIRHTEIDEDEIAPTTGKQVINEESRS